MAGAGDAIISIPVYDGVDLLDIAAPREVFFQAGTHLREPQLRVVCVAATLDPVVTRDGLRLAPDATFDDPAVGDPLLIWVPGGSPEALARILDDPHSALLDYVTDAGGRSTYVSSVCEGAVLLARTGLLDGYDATTHWAFYPCMEAFDVHMVPPSRNNAGHLVYPRFVHDGGTNRITGGGISSGLDMALYVTSILFGEEIAEKTQVVLQYFPVPPVDGAILDEPTACPIPGRST